MNILTTRTIQTLNGTATNFSYASASNELVATSGGAGLANTYGYDANGNGNTVSLNGTTAYTYGPFNRLINAPGASFTIGAEGQRLAKIGGGNTTYFAADAGGSPLAEDDSGTWHDNVWLNGRLIGVIANGNIYAAHTDQTGRPIALTNASDAIVWQANGLPFDRTITANTYGDFNLERGWAVPERQPRLRPGDGAVHRKRSDWIGGWGEYVCVCGG